VNSLTVAYITCRRDCRIDWFLNSLSKQLLPDRRLSLIVVDHFYEERKEEFSKKFVYHVPPKPNVWNGPYRLTKTDWFAAASQRNTAICLCKTTHLAMVDDLSVLMPGWLSAVWEAIEGGYVGLGAYRKVKDLVVKDGEVISYTETPSGIDDRLKRVEKDVSECDGGWCYGCSLVLPLEDALEVGGFPEICDGIGSEDYCFGIALRNAGKHLKFDRRMLTLEDEDLHFNEPPFRRTDKGVSPNDKSHAVLEIAKSSKYFPNYYEGGIRALRDYVLAGNPFPIAQIPTHDWFDGQPISEMT
jgi:hypothetical protein